MLVCFHGLQKVPNLNNRNRLGEEAEDVCPRWEIPQLAAEAQALDLALPQDPRACLHQILERTGLVFPSSLTSTSAFGSLWPLWARFIDNPSSAPQAFVLASRLGISFLFLTPSHGLDLRHTISLENSLLSSHLKSQLLPRSWHCWPCFFPLSVTHHYSILCTNCKHLLPHLHEEEAGHAKLTWPGAALH